MQFEKECVCLYVERDRGRERKRERESERDTKRSFELYKIKTVYNEVKKREAKKPYKYK